MEIKLPTEENQCNVQQQHSKVKKKEVLLSEPVNWAESLPMTRSCIPLKQMM